MGLKRKVKKAAIIKAATGRQGLSLAHLKQMKKDAKQSPRIYGKTKARRVNKKVAKKAYSTKKKSTKY